jgi:hypothetical protein
MTIAVVVCSDNTNDRSLDSRIILPNFHSTVKDCAVFSTKYSSSSDSTGARISRLLIFISTTARVPSSVPISLQDYSSGSIVISECVGPSPVSACVQMRLNFRPIRP